MRIIPWRSARAAPARCGAAVAVILGLSASAWAQGPRPMTFMDVQDMRSFGSEAPSPDGRSLLYTITTPDWKTAKEQSDVFLVSLADGVASSRQMTFTKEYNETSPRWSRDGKAFAFLSNRDAPASAPRQNQIYLLRPDGGDARRITDAKDGVADFAFSRDGRWLVYRAGKPNEQQLYRLSVAAVTAGDAAAEQLTRQPAGVGRWEIAPDSRRIYFIAPDSVDQDEKRRLEADFTVTVYHMEKPLESLWALELEPLAATRLTRDPSYSVTGFTVSNDSRWVGFRGVSSDRFKRTRGGMVMGGESNLYTELYLLEAATGQIEQITRAEEIGKGGPYFSPDSRWVAFTAPRDLTRYTRGLTQRVYLRAVGQRGGEFRRIGDSYDGNVGLDFWSLDGATIYFNDGVRTTEQLLALDVARGTVRELTNQDAGLRVERDPETGVVLINYSNGSTPATLYAVASVDQVPNRSAWRQLTDVNPQVRGFALGVQEEITWRSTDGKLVGGVITYPVGYQRGTRYPLIVWIHGGPAAADVNRFNASSQVYAGDGYVVLRPNYRGSTNYGAAFNDINGNYFPQGFDDIMAGVDHLIAQGIVDGNRMGAMGWSAGGHWSNWILTHTDRFKAISTGAGAMNWISMYAQTDGQRHRQEYFGGKLPYHDFDAYWNQSPLKYILNAKTPTMIHVVKGDPRVPAPQSAELFMALKQLGVPTEFFMYPGDTHGIPDARNRMVKAMAEKAWMDHYVRGIGERFAWADVRRELLKTLGDAGERRPVTSDRSSGER